MLHIIPWRWKVKIIFLSFHGWWLQAVKAAVRANKAGEIFINDWTMGKIATLPETNIAPKNDGFPVGISFSRGVFSGAMLVSRMVAKLFGGGNSNTFYLKTPKHWGRHPIWLNLTNIFQMGWFNHQLVSDRYLVQDFAIWFILIRYERGWSQAHCSFECAKNWLLQRRYCFGGDVEDCLLYFARWPQQLGWKQDLTMVKRLNYQNRNNRRLHQKKKEWYLIGSVCLKIQRQSVLRWSHPKGDNFIFGKTSISPKD